MLLILPALESAFADDKKTMGSTSMVSMMSMVMMMSMMKKMQRREERKRRKKKRRVWGRRFVGG